MDVAVNPSTDVIVKCLKNDAGNWARSVYYKCGNGYPGKNFNNNFISVLVLFGTAINRN
jgi:hypothetical protein